jgi:hypothetical protein
MLGLLLILISKSWGCPHPRARHAFPRQRHMHRRGGYLFCQGFLPCMMPSMDGWQVDGWMDRKLHEKRPRRPLLYVMQVRIGPRGV